MIKGQKIYLRSLQLNDLNTIFEWENNPDNWFVSNTIEPYTKDEIMQFILNQLFDKDPCQKRYMICLLDKHIPIGTIDLFDINSKKSSAGIGILINDAKYKNKGYGTEAIQLLIEIVQNEHKINKLYCSIHLSNDASKKIFLKNNFIIKQLKEDGLYYLELNFS